MYIKDNKLIFIVYNHNSKSISKPNDCSKHVQKDATLKYKHLGYLYHPCKLGGFKNLIDFSNDELIDFITDLNENRKYIRMETLK